jgi:hypothetical protein
MNPQRKASVVVVMVGDMGVGKSEFAVVNNKEFRPVPMRGRPSRVDKRVLASTIGVDLVEAQRTHVECLENSSTHTPACVASHRNTTVDYQIWDTAGQERFRSSVHMMTHRADVILLFYDLTDARSFDSLSGYWLEEIGEHKDPRVCPHFIIGTKADMLKENGGEFDRAVPFSRVDALAEQLDATAFDTNSVSDGGWYAHHTFTLISAELVKTGYAERTVAAKRGASSAVQLKPTARRAKIC